MKSNLPIMKANNVVVMSHLFKSNEKKRIKTIISALYVLAGDDKCDWRERRCCQSTKSLDLWHKITFIRGALLKGFRYARI